ncbi:MAG: hypothetical protein ACOX19_12495 [Fermentimonas sp.]
MKRRDFITTATLGSLFYASKGVLPARDFSGLEIKETNLLDPLIPFPFKYFPELEKEMLSYIIELNKHYGFRRFLFTGPTKEFRYTGFPDKKVFIDLGERILNVKKQLTDYDIEIGWWCATTIRIGKGKFQNIIRDDGSIAQEACCPLDANYRETFSDYIATVAQIANPFLINFEDDFHLSGGCFCPLHLEEFSKREGKHYSREELQILFGSKTLDGYRLNESWGKLKRDSLAGLATSVREKVDKIAPETRLCLCQSGASERDGNFTEDVTKAFAGSTRPIVRVYGSSYFSDDPLDIPKSIFNVLYQRQHLPDNFELIHESDTFPHTRFFMSSRKLKTLMTAAFAYGLDDSLLYVNQYLENPVEEDGYREMYLKEARRLSILKQIAQKCTVEGCEIFRKPTTSFNWVNIMGRHGIPYTSKGGKVKLVSGNIIEQMERNEITELLSGNVFLDGYSALLLCQKGYSNLIGVEISTREDTLLPPFYERVVNPEKISNIKNRLMYNYAWAFNKDNRDCFYQIKALTGTEVITEFTNSKNEPFYPALTRFENKLGGRVAVMSYNLNDNYINTRCISLFNYTKKEIMRQIIEWLGKEPLPVFVKNIPNAFCIFGRSKSNDYAITVVTGLNSDTFNSLSLEVSNEWVDSQIQMLNNNGDWQTVKTEKQERTITIYEKISVMNPIILRLNKV